MTWAEFVEAVRVDLPVDNERIGIATGDPNYLNRQIQYAAIQLQQSIEFYTKGHETVYGPDDLVVDGMASVGSLPDSDQCKPQFGTFDKTGAQCASRPLSTYPWEHRRDLVCGSPKIVNGQFYMAIDPQGKQFVVFPLVSEDQQISLSWEGVRMTFADADVVPFDLDCVEAVGLFVKAKIARLVDHDLNEHNSYMADWSKRKALLYSDTRDRVRLNKQSNSPGVPSRCGNVPFCGLPRPLWGGPRENTLEFCAFGDSGEPDTIANTLAVSSLVRSLKPNFVMHLGDCNYPAGDPVTLQANLLRYYGLFIPAAFYLAFGNHDIETDGGAALEALLTKQAALNNGKTYYQFVPASLSGIAYASLFVLDTNAADPAEQAAWLEAALAGSSMWNIIVMHKSPYTSDESHAPGDAIWRLPFKEWGADLVISAHGHNYERFYIDGTPYIVCGLGGATKRGFVDPPVTGSQFRYNLTYGSLYVTARVDRLQTTLYDPSGNVVDRIAVERALANA